MGAEYIAMGDVVKMVQVCRHVLGLFQPGHKQKCVIVFEDNEGATKLAGNPLGPARSVDIAVRHHILRKSVAKQEIKTSEMSTEMSVEPVLGFNTFRAPEMNM